MSISMGNRKKALAYVPWVALVAFLFIFVGMIVWAAGANKALSNTDAALKALQVVVESYLDTIHSVGVGAAVVCCLMSALMVAMSGGRTCVEKAVDEKGKAVCGSWLWLAVEAVLCALWWLILFWLVFVIFGSCLWYGAAYTARGVLRVSINTASQRANSTAANMTASPPPPPSPPSNSSICDQACLNLAIFDFLVQQNLCICDTVAMQTALDHTNKAYSALGSVVAGAFLLWVGASFLLMNAVADFAKTKRERELLLRAQRAAVDGAASHLALGTAHNNALYAQYGGDNLPLLQAQALQQQQLQMQMQMMAAAQAQKATTAGAAPVQAPGMRSGPGSQAALGSHV